MTRVLIQMTFLLRITWNIKSEACKLQEKNAVARVFSLHWGALAEFKQSIGWLSSNYISINDHNKTQQMRELLVPNHRNCVCTSLPELMPFDLSGPEVEQAWSLPQRGSSTVLEQYGSHGKRWKISSVVLNMTWRNATDGIKEALTTNTGLLCF